MHTRRRARFASRAAAFAAAASAGDSPLPAASEAAAAAAAPCPGGRGGLPAPGGFSVFRLREGVTRDAAVWGSSRMSNRTQFAAESARCQHRVIGSAQESRCAAKSGLRAPFCCYALVAALLLIVVFLHTS